MKVLASARLFEGAYDEERVASLARELKADLCAAPSLAFVFATEQYQVHWADFSEILRVHGHIPELIGATSVGIIGTNEELEDKAGFSILVLHLPESRPIVLEITNEMVESAEGPEYWHRKTNVLPDQVDSWIAVVECVRFQVETWLNQWNAAYPKIPVIGGLVGGENKVYHNEMEVNGGVLVGWRHQGHSQPVVAQGCKPIGSPFTITGVEQNVLYTLGSLPAYQVLNEAFEGLTNDEKERARNNLFAGLALSEYIEEFKRGDFLVRHILGADPGTGAVALSALPRVGQTLQYQLRDASSASEEMQMQLAHARELLKGTIPSAGLIFCCTGRGRNLFGKSNQDAQQIDAAFPKLPLAGFFAAGEIGPVGHKNYIHGYTASVAIIS